MNKMLFSVALAALMVAPGFASAETCDRPDAIDIAGIAYIDDRTGGEVGAINHWFYAESNGAEGLQAGGGDVTGAPDPDFGGCDNPDTLLF